MRFFIAPCFIALELGFFWLSRIDRASLARLLVLTALAVPAVFTVYWICERKQLELGAWTVRGEFESTRRGGYGMNCRTIAGARLGQTPELTYIDTSAWYRYAGVVPSSLRVCSDIRGT